MNSREKFYGIDFIRIIATTLIIFHHYQQITNCRFATGVNFYDGRFEFGYIVELFFLLSGFLLGTYTKDIKDHKVSFKNFFFKKYLRFLPMCFITACVYYIIEQIRFWKMGSYTLAECTLWDVIESAFIFHSGGAFPASMVNNPTWYIAVLLICYIVYYFVTWICSLVDIDETYLYIGMVLLAVGIITYRYNIPYFNERTARGYLCVFWGIILRNVIYDDKYNVGIRNKFIDQISVCFVYVLVIFVMLRYIFLNPNEKDIMYILVFILYTAILLLALNKNISKMFNFKLFHFLGKVSFDVYVWHLNIIICVIMLNTFMQTGMEFVSRCTMVIVCCLIWLLGMISYFVLDRPISEAIKKKMNLCN